MLTGCGAVHARLQTTTESNRDVFRCSAGRGNWVAMLPHTFKMKLHGFANEFLYLIERRTSDTQARKVRRVSSPTRRRLFVNDKIFHFSPACLRILFNVPCAMSTDGCPAPVTVPGFAE